MFRERNFARARRKFCAGRDRFSAVPLDCVGTLPAELLVRPFGLLQLVLEAHDPARGVHRGALVDELAGAGGEPRWWRE